MFEMAKAKIAYYRVVKTGRVDLTRAFNSRIDAEIHARNFNKIQGSGYNWSKMWATVERVRVDGTNEPI
jgi:hypothetical protein